MAAPTTGEFTLGDTSAGHIGSMPGWHVVADLTPPELIAARRLKVVRLLVLIVVVIVAAACAGGYYFARQQAAAAATDLEAAQATSTTLQAQQRSFAGVTALQGTLDAVRGQIATLLAADVDFSQLLGDIGAALPPGMTINQAAITITPPADGKAGSGDAGGASALDASGVTHIGTVTLAGTGQTLEDLPVFIQRLRAIDGVFDPYPLANQVVTTGSDIGAGTGTTYSVQITLTDARLSHAFDMEAK
jgi:hypothetical protein